MMRSAAIVLVLFLGRLPAAAVPLDLMDGIVCRWMLDDTPLDVSCFGDELDLNNVSYSGDVPGAIGSGKSLSFYSASSYAQGLIPFGVTNYTISIWVNASISAVFPMNIMARTDAAGNLRSPHLRINGGGRFEAYMYDGDDRVVTGTTTAARGTWHHVMLTVQNGETLTLYVNGSEEAAVTGQSLRLTGDRWKIGGDAAGCSAFLGRVDEIAIWARVLSESERAGAAGGRLAPPIICGGESEVYKAGDINRDWAVNLGDILTMLNDWLGCTDPANPDCTI